MRAGDCETRRRVPRYGRSRSGTDVGDIEDATRSAMVTLAGDIKGRAVRGVNAARIVSVEHVAQRSRGIHRTIAAPLPE